MQFHFKSQEVSFYLTQLLLANSGVYLLLKLQNKKNFLLFAYIKKDERFAKVIM